MCAHIHAYGRHVFIQRCSLACKHACDQPCNHTTRMHAHIYAMMHVYMQMGLCSKLILMCFVSGSDRADLPLTYRAYNWLGEFNISCLYLAEGRATASDEFKLAIARVAKFLFGFRLRPSHVSMRSESGVRKKKIQWSFSERSCSTGHHVRVILHDPCLCIRICTCLFVLHVCLMCRSCAGFGKPSPAHSSLHPSLFAPHRNPTLSMRHLHMFCLFFVFEWICVANSQ